MSANRAKVSLLQEFQYSSAEPVTVQASRRVHMPYEHADDTLFVVYKPKYCEFCAVESEHRHRQDNWSVPVWVSTRCDTAQTDIPKCLAGMT